LHRRLGHQRAGPPPAAQLGTHGILAAAQQISNIIALVLNTFAVQGPLRRQYPIPDFLSIDPQLIQPQARHRHHGPPDRLGRVKFLTQYGCRPLTAVVTAAPVGQHPAINQLVLRPPARLDGIQRSHRRPLGRILIPCQHLHLRQRKSIVRPLAMA